VTLRVQRGVSSLREHSLFLVVRKALAAAKKQFGFSLVHFSVQQDHLHLIAEALDRRALSRGVQGLSIRVARAVNRELERKGRLFADRYHARALKTPREVRFALRYVLLNAHKHARGLQGLASRIRVYEGVPAKCRPGTWFDVRVVEAFAGADGAWVARARVARVVPSDAFSRYEVVVNSPPGHDQY
jgi:REP element-mobilizing transposase RayT